MKIETRDIEKAFAQYGPTHSGRKEDYFAALYLARAIQRPESNVLNQVAFGANDSGLDAFHIDRERRNLYLYICRWNDRPLVFRDALQKLTEGGLELIFGGEALPSGAPQFLHQLRATLYEDQSLIDRVLVVLVYNGTPEAAEKSEVIQHLQENLETKKHLVDAFFAGRSVGLALQFKSNTGQVGGKPPGTVSRHPLVLSEQISTGLEDGVRLSSGFVRLSDFLQMYRSMGQKLFARNIRAGLSADRPPNKAIRESLKRIVIERSQPPGLFVFNHNGITVAAEKLEVEAGRTYLVEPRVLNGAQTVTSFATFADEYAAQLQSPAARALLEKVQVQARIITGASPDMVVGVTLCTNRQNPVEPWNLRASDLTQVELQERFHELKVYYERQENAFETLPDEERDELIDNKAVEIKRLAQTLLAAQGEVDRISRLREVFEREEWYRATFSERLSTVDLRRVLLAYKVQFRLNKAIRELRETSSEDKYGYVRGARNLVWALLIQGLLNHDKVDEYVEQYGSDLSLDASFGQLMGGLASGKVRHMLREGLSDTRSQELIREEKYSFLRTKATFERCMAVAREKYGWKRLSL